MLTSSDSTPIPRPSPGRNERRNGRRYQSGWIKDFRMSFHIRRRPSNRVFSTFMFHHLMVDNREKTLYERVLTPRGSLHMLDFTGTEASGYWPCNELGFERWRHIRTVLARYFHSSHRLKDNSEKRIVSLMNRAGFISCEKVMEGTILFGSLRIAYYQASAPCRGSTASSRALG